MERIKTDMRIPRKTWEALDKISVYLGIPKNGLVTLGASKLCLELLGLLPARSRMPVLQDLEKDFLELIAEVKSRCKTMS